MLTWKSILLCIYCLVFTFNLSHCFLPTNNNIAKQFNNKHNVLYLAKNKNNNNNNNNSNNASKGFGKTKVDSTELLKQQDVAKMSSGNAKLITSIVDSDTILSSDDANDNDLSYSPASSGGSKTIKANDDDIDRIFKKYGLDDKKNTKKAIAKKDGKLVVKRVDTSSKAASQEQPFGESVLAGISPALQARIDNILVTCTFSALIFVVLSGISISVGALQIVFPSIKISDDIDYVLKNFLTPAFTPSLGVFFLFSITFGLFKFAQISSSQTVYKE